MSFEKEKSNEMKKDTPKEVQTPTALERLTEDMRQLGKVMEEEHQTRMKQIREKQKVVEKITLETEVARREI